MNIYFAFSLLSRTGTCLMKSNLPSITAQAAMKSKYSIEKNSVVGETIVSI